MLGIARYRDLLFFLVRRDFVARYQQTVLGPLWHIIQPLFTTVVFTLIFGNIARLPTDRIPPPLFYLCGLVAWNFFVATFSNTSNTFLSNAGIFGKVYFPRLIIPLSFIISNAITFLIQMGAFSVLYVYFKFFTGAGILIKPNLLLFALPLVLLQISVFGLGIGLWMAALSAKYRDILVVLGFITQLWMYATPVIYPLSMVPEKWRFLAALNPMSMSIEAFKYALFGTGIINASYFTLSAAITLIVTLSGLVLFNRAEGTFIDTV